MLKFVITLLIVAVTTVTVKSEVNDCSSNPCNGPCEVCVNNPQIRCFQAPCPQYECRKKENCKVPSVDDLPKNDNCRLPAESGMCLAYFPKFFFNVSSNNCEGFVYGGCGGNENKFSTKLECERVCVLGQECPMVKLAAPKPGCRYDKDPREDGCPKNELVCDVKPGDCPTSFNDTSFDACTAECSTSDTECEGNKKCCKIGCNLLCLSPAVSASTEKPSAANGNRENTRKLPTRIRNDSVISNTDMPKRDFCKLPKDAGRCKAAKQKWYYNIDSLKCEQFLYGGCDGNDNRFATKEECERICIAGKDCPTTKRFPDPEGCRVVEERGIDGCPMRKLVCDVKPGNCPQQEISSFDLCTNECISDEDCKGTKKCCKNDCNSVCVQPEGVVKPPIPVNDSRRGQCPPVTVDSSSSGICAITCNNDTDCKENMKCCANECGGLNCVSTTPVHSVCNLMCTVGKVCKIIDEKAQCVSNDSNSGDPCASNPCKKNERCAVLECLVAPCTAYQCLPMFPPPQCVNNQCRPCQMCVATPLMCLRAPCPQYMCQDNCGECSTCSESGTCEKVTGQSETCTSDNICENRECRKYPQAKCFIDKCNCQRHLFRLPNNTVFTQGECNSL